MSEFHSPIKVVALDLDGTIVNESLTISERTQKLLKHLITQGDVKVVIATGRMFFSAVPFAQSLGVTEPLITYQGAMIRNLDADYSLRYHNPIKLATAETLLKFLLEQKFDINLYVNDHLWTTHDNAHATFYARTSGIEPKKTNDLLSVMSDAPTKIMVIDNHRVSELLVELERQFAGQLSYCRSRSNFCEMIDVDSSKWNAIQHLLNIWHIKPEEVMAIGDQGNDLSMIKGAGIGVAMGNAPDEVKAFANYVTGPIEEDGVAEAIEQFVLGDMPIKSYSP
ncbi:MAG: Cof-type HAD-IIB family hydrolase [Vampirovibrionales bacterium]|nr:Cof-type HAD-IIB family hydrolase [Vampirovibrionales bacterium]